MIKIRPDDITDGINSSYARKSIFIEDTFIFSFKLEIISYNRKYSRMISNIFNERLL